MMAPQQKERKQSQDPYAQRGKQLTSAVQRLRGWVGSDPSRNVELADALVELNTHRLLGHDYAAAASDARDALRRSAELLSANGPIGPYTSVEDAVRYLTAVVHLAVTQVALGLPESADRTIASMDEVEEQLSKLPVQERLAPMTAIWALSCRARSRLASGDVGLANAYADAALARLAESGLRADPDSCYLAIDTDRLASDSRWAAGRPQESLGFLHDARERYDQMVDGRLRDPAGLSPALVSRLAEPLFGLYRDMADRLIAGSEIDLGLVTRRELIALLRGLIGRLGQSAQVQLASALTDLADNLVKSDRVDEADLAASEAAETMPDSPGARSALQDAARGVVRRGMSPQSWNPLPMSASYAATTASAAETAGAETTATRTEPAEVATWLEGERSEAHRLELERGEQARIEAARRKAEQAEAEQAAAERVAEERARAEREARTEAERQVAAEAAERLERKRRRLERLEAHRLEAERREAERREAERTQTERAEAERLEAERKAFPPNLGR
jgi:hypothetical protein